MDKRITCLLGAGAAIEIEGPSTSAITSKISEAIETRKITKNVIDLYHTLCQGLREQRGNTPNFEEIFHAVELLSNFLPINRPDSDDIFHSGNRSINSIIPILMSLREAFDSFTYGDAVNILQIITEVIGENINKYSESFSTNDTQWFSSFWQNLETKVKLDIGTLNYDTCLEQSIGECNYNDGFSEKVEVTGNPETTHAFRFHPENLDLSDQLNRSRIMHLHGCILYGPATILPINKYAFEDSFYDMFKYAAYSEACHHWFNRSNPKTQSGEDTVIGPFITGLRKTEKILANPYEFYHYEFQRAILNNNALLIIGYSCGDLYLNNILIRLLELHGKNRRIVWITHNVGLQNPPSDNECQVIGRLLEDEYYDLFHRLSNSGIEYVSFQDGCMRIYFNGFKYAVKNHGKEIIKFLMN